MSTYGIKKRKRYDIRYERKNVTTTKNKAHKFIVEYKLFLEIAAEFTF